MHAALQGVDAGKQQIYCLLAFLGVKELSTTTIGGRSRACVK